MFSSHTKYYENYLKLLMVISNRSYVGSLLFGMLINNVKLMHTEERFAIHQ